MAITLVGVAENTGSGSVVVTLPVGVAQNDFVVACVGSQEASDANVTESSGTYAEQADLYSNDTNDTNFAAYTKLQGATPDTTVSMDAGGGAHAGVMMVLRGIDLTTPIDAATTTASGIDSGQTNPPSITTVTNDAWVLACGASAISDATVNGPSGYTDRVDVNSTSITVMMARLEKATAGAEDPPTYTLETEAVARSWTACTIAIRPAAGAGDIDGTLDVTFDNFTLSASADILIQGSLAQTFADFTLSASADLLIQGTLGQTFADFTLAATGELVALGDIDGALAETIADFILTAGGDLLIQGTLAQTFGNFTLSSTGTLEIEGQMSGAIDPFMLNATGDLLLSGAMAGAIGAFSLTANGTLLINGALGVTIGDFTLSAAGSGLGAAIDGTLNALIDPFILDAAGDNPDFPPAPGGTGSSYRPVWRPRRGR